MSSLYGRYGKRIFDIVLASFILVVTLPVTLLVMLVLCLTNDGRVLFVQERPGRHMKPFGMLKFESMNRKRDAGGELLPDEERLTPVGRFIRRTSLDELPQLINVIRGEMSLIGPRPLIREQLGGDAYEESRRHSVRPGITGWAQVNGRNNLSFDDRFRHDAWYVEHLSFRTDLKIIWLTLLSLIRQDGVDGVFSPYADSRQEEPESQALLSVADEDTPEILDPDD